jgi:hypothetical protein
MGPFTDLIQELHFALICVWCMALRSFLCVTVMYHFFYDYSMGPLAYMLHCSLLCDTVVYYCTCVVSECVSA